MSDVDAGVRQEARLAGPLSFTLQQHRTLDIDKLETYLEGIKALVALFAAPTSRRTRTSKGTYSMSFETRAYRVTSMPIARGVSGRIATPKPIHIRAISYNSPLEIIIEAPFPLIVTSVSTVTGVGFGLLKFWEKLNKARVTHAQSNAAISKAKTEQLAWDAMREQLEMPTELSKLPKSKQRQIKQAIKFIEAVDEIKLIEK
ncbi:hypothetical protein UB45_05025 [Terrabacter sp. 28]|nr:hypothetical protein UB45_05025 [Terrabacter sp. 28]